MSFQTPTGYYTSPINFPAMGSVEPNPFPNGNWNPP